MSSRSSHRGCCPDTTVQVWLTDSGLNDKRPQIQQSQVGQGRQRAGIDKLLLSRYSRRRLVKADSSGWLCRQAIAWSPTAGSHRDRRLVKLASTSWLRPDTAIPPTAGSTSWLLSRYSHCRLVKADSRDRQAVAVQTAAGWPPPAGSHRQAGCCPDTVQVWLSHR